MIEKSCYFIAALRYYIFSIILCIMLATVTGNQGFRSSIMGSLRAKPALKPTVLCIGEVLYDCIADSQCNGWSIQEVTKDSLWTKFPGGAPANVACAYNKLNGKSSFVGAVGDDLEGQELIDVLNRIGVDTTGIVKVSHRDTRQVMVVRDMKGDREFAGFIGGRNSNYFADCYYPDDNNVDSLITTFDPNQASAIVMGTLGLVHGTTATMMNNFVNYLKTRKMSSSSVTHQYPFLVVDVNWRKAFWKDVDEDIARSKILRFVEGVDIVKLTDVEAKWLCNVNPAEALAEPKLLFDILKVKVGVIITGGELGASYYLKGIGSHFRPAYIMNVVETTGAGDAFTAGFLKVLLSSTDIVLNNKDGADFALDFACAAGGITCCQPGAIAAQPFLDDVLELVNKETYSIV